MAFYTEVIFYDDGLTLKSFKEKVPRQPILLEEVFISKGELEYKFKKLAKIFPRRIRIMLEPEEIIFKNTKLPFKDEKLLVQAVQFEGRKYFRISEEEFIFTYNIWKRSSGEFWLTLLGVGCNIIEKYIPFLRTGFIPMFVIREFLSSEKGLVFCKKKIDLEKESLRVYYNGFLIGWKVYKKENIVEARKKLIEYIKNLDLPMPEEVKIKALEHFQDKEIILTAGPLASIIMLSLRRLFWKFSAIFLGILVVIYITVSFAQLNVKKQNLKQLEDKIRVFQKEYRITDLGSIRKKVNLKGAEISRIILAINKHFPKNKKVSRFEYKDGEVVMTIREIDTLEANRIKEAMENESSFSHFRIEQGVVSNEGKIIFQVKK